MRKSRRVLRLGLTINVILHWYKKYKYHNCYETQTDRIIESIQRALSDRSTGMSNRILHRKWKYSICCFRDVIEKIGGNIPKIISNTSIFGVKFSWTTTLWSVVYRGVSRPTPPTSMTVAGKQPRGAVISQSERLVARGRKAPSAMDTTTFPTTDTASS